MSTRKNFDLERFPENRVSQRMVSRVSPIYERSYVAKWLYEVMGREVDDAEIRFSELREQANPETATWALRYWEQRYGIEVNESRDIELRRAEIMTRRGTRHPMNPARMERTLRAMTGRNILVIENVAPYTFCVEIEALDRYVGIDAAIEKIKKIKPSHQAFTVCVTAKFETSVTTRVVGQCYRTSVKLTVPIVGTITPRPIRSTSFAAGASTSTLTRMTVKIGGIPK